MNLAEAKDILIANGEDCTYLKELVDGRFVYLHRFVFTIAILVIDEENIYYGYTDRWCYHSLTDAKEAFNTWDGTTPEPEGWHRHPNSGRRRPDGDKEKEYINL